MFLFSTAGILLTSNTTLPYQMLAEYHKDSVYRSKSASGTKRGLGNYQNLYYAYVLIDESFFI